MGPEMMSIPAGGFDMGSKEGVGDSDEWPLRKDVRVAAFEMGRTEVTVEQYEACVNDRGYDKPEWRQKDNVFHYQTGGNDWYRKLGTALYAKRSPVVGVSWLNAQQYVKWLREVMGKTYRLPSEAEWEYACKAGKETTYCGSDAVGQIARTAENIGGKMHAVGSLENGANAWGLLDMSENVREWTEDCRHEDYKGAPRDGGVRAGGNCKRHAVRGGSWIYNPSNARAASRDFDDVGYRNSVLGFRVARTAR